MLPDASKCMPGPGLWCSMAGAHCCQLDMGTCHLRSMLPDASILPRTAQWLDKFMHLTLCCAPQVLVVDLSNGAAGAAESDAAPLDRGSSTMLGDEVAQGEQDADEGLTSARSQGLPPRA